MRYIVERQLAGDDAALRETAIGLEVYGRPASYDPKTDPIVRVEASRLRSRLREYYESEGANDPIRIDMPKGSYVPSFERRIAVVAQSTETAPTMLEPDAAVSSRASRSWFLPASVALLALALVAGGLYWHRAVGKLKPIESLSVMAFVDLSEKKDLEFIAEGISEQIQDELARIRDLRLVGSAATNASATGKQMGVDALVEGSVRAEGGKLRVAVRLLDGANGSNLWTGSFDGDRTGLFELEERIAQSVAEKLSIQLAVRREGVDARSAPARAQAHDYYRQARALAEHDSAAPLDEIFRLYELAENTDPD